MSENIKISEKEIEEKVKFLSSAKCNHTQHMYIDITDDLVQGTLLARIMYWFSVDKNKKSKVRIFKDGYFWIAKQRKDWWEEIRITERQYDKAIKELGKKGFVELAKYKFNSMPTIHIRPNYDNINSSTEKWENELREKIISEYESELQNEAYGNNTKCNSLGNYIKRNTGVTQENNLLTYITNNDYDNRDYNSETTKGQNINKVNGEVKTSFSENQKKMSAHKTPKQKYLDKKAEEVDMLNRTWNICNENYEEETANEIFNTLEHYFKRFTEKTGRIHPILKDKTLFEITDKMNTYYDTEYSHFSNLTEQPGAFIKMVDMFFDGDFGGMKGYETNWNLPAFMSDGILNRLGQRLYEAGEIC